MLKGSWHGFYFNVSYIIIWLNASGVWWCIIYSSMSCSGNCHMQMYLLVWRHRPRNIITSHFGSFNYINALFIITVGGSFKLWNVQDVPMVRPLRARPHRTFFLWKQWGMGKKRKVSRCVFFFKVNWFKHERRVLRTLPCSGRCKICKTMEIGIGMGKKTHAVSKDRGKYDFSCHDTFKATQTQSRWRDGAAFTAYGADNELFTYKKTMKHAAHIFIWLNRILWNLIIVLSHITI